MRTRRVLAQVTGWQVVASSCYYSLFVATPFLQATFGVSRLLVGVAVTTLTLGYTLALFPAGAAVDALGERPVLVWGLVALGAGVVAVGLAPGYLALLAAALALGAAYASAMPASNRAIVRGVPVAERGLAMGVKQVGVTAGSGLAAVVVVSVAPAVASWEVGLYVIGLVALLVAGAFYATYEGTAGSGALAWPNVRGLGADRTYLALVVAGLFLGAALFTTVAYATLYLTEAVAVSTGVAGAAFAAMQAAGSAGRVVAGRAADYLLVARGWSEARAAAAVLLGQAVLGAALLAGLATLPGPAVALVLLVGVGFSVVGFTGVYYACLTAIAGDAEIGTATAGGQAALNAGALVAPPAFGLLADVLGYGASWTLLAALVLVGAAFAWLVGRRAPRRRGPATPPEI